MSDHGQSAGEFPQPVEPQIGFRAGQCPECKRRVLAARALVEDRLVDQCIHCGYRFDSKRLERIDAQAARGLGYVVDGQADEECDSHGGCRSGECGVRQPKRG